MKLAYVILIASAIIFAGCNREDKLKNDPANDDLLLNVDEPTPDETDFIAEDTTSELKVKDEEKVIDTPDSGKRRFYIIGGSFKEFKNAEKMYLGLVNKGVAESQILDPVNQFNRVVLAAYDDSLKAYQELNRLRVKHGDNTIWMLRGK